MPRKVFTAGEILTAADVNTNLMDQAVMVFDDSAARDSAIPTPSEGMVTYLKDTDALEKFDGSNFVTVSPPDGFTAQQTITATDATWPVPTLASPIVKVTVVGGGGGGGGGGAGSSAGGTGGTTTFNAGGAGSVSAVGGIGGTPGTSSETIPGEQGRAGLTAGNNGTAGNRREVSPGRSNCGANGTGGEVRVAYLNLSGVSNVNVTIGGGGSAGGATVSDAVGGPGNRGEVIVEYVAA